MGAASRGLRRHGRTGRARVSEYLPYFARPMPWSAILVLEPVLTQERWRTCIIDAEDRGLLRWIPPNEHDGEVGAWTLTDLGRARYVRPEQTEPEHGSDD